MINLTLYSHGYLRAEASSDVPESGDGAAWRHAEETDGVSVAGAEGRGCHRHVYDAQSKTKGDA